MKKALIIKEQIKALVVPQNTGKPFGVPVSQALTVALSNIVGGIAEVMHNRAIAKIENAPLKHEARRQRAADNQLKMQLKTQEKAKKRHENAILKQQTLTQKNQIRLAEKEAAHELKMVELENAQALKLAEKTAPPATVNNSATAHQSSRKCHHGDLNVQINFFDKRWL